MAAKNKSLWRPNLTYPWEKLFGEGAKGRRARFRNNLEQYFFMRAISVLVIALALTGCTSTPAELEAKTTPLIKTYPDNYQEIYRRVSTTAKRCFAANMGPYASMAVDTELYSELGYGELTVSLINMGVRNYYVSVRVEKQSAGSKLTVRSSNTLASEQYKSLILGWAGGDQNCPIN